MNEQSRTLVALDTDTTDAALDLARRLQGHVAGYKVGLELVNAAGFELFDDLKALAGDDVKIFYDGKFHDIPNTVAGASRAAGRRGVWMFNVHASGGSAMLKAAVQGAEGGAAQAGVKKPLVIAVSVLTSLSADVLRDELGVSRSLPEQVVALARLAQDAGCAGLVASPQEIGAIREACGPDFLLVIPGVRPAGSSAWGSEAGDDAGRSREGGRGLSGGWPAHHGGSRPCGGGPCHQP